MKFGSKIFVSVSVVLLFLIASSAPLIQAAAEEVNEKNENICELTYDGQTKSFTTVAAAVSDWNEHGIGKAVLKIYETGSTPICENPIHIEQKGSSLDRTLLIEGQGNVQMKISGNAAGTDHPCVFYITAQSDFSQTPSLDFRNITFDLTSATTDSYGIYAYGTETKRYIRGIYVDTCTFIGTTDANCVAVETRQNGSADFTIFNCTGVDLHTMFNGYCFQRENTYGLTMVNCNLIN